MRSEQIDIVSEMTSLNAFIILQRTGDDALFKSVVKNNERIIADTHFYIINNKTGI